MPKEIDTSRVTYLKKNWLYLATGMVMTLSSINVLLMRWRMEKDCFWVAWIFIGIAGTSIIAFHVRKCDKTTL